MANLVVNHKASKRKKELQTVAGVMVLLLAIFLILYINKEDEKYQKLLVGAASSMKPAMEELLERYRKQNPDIQINITYASSGTLEQQIRQGAPIDVYLSADLQNMNSLREDHLIIDETLVELLKNTIILIAPIDSNLKLLGFEDLPKVSTVAIGDPRSVPAGKYAYEIFHYMNLWEVVKARTTYGKDVTEVLAWVSSGNVDIGVVYATDAALSDKVRIVADAPEESHSSIIYPAAVVKGSEEVIAAKNFIDFLISQEAKTIFVKYGFQTIDHDK